MVPGTRIAPASDRSARSRYKIIHLLRSKGLIMALEPQDLGAIIVILIGIAILAIAALVFFVMP